jgi:hypothetical protein
LSPLKYGTSFRASPTLIKSSFIGRRLAQEGFELVGSWDIMDWEKTHHRLKWMLSLLAPASGIVAGQDPVV